jgi:hypothetical protein
MNASERQGPERWEDTRHRKEQEDKECEELQSQLSL